MANRNRSTVKDGMIVGYAIELQHAQVISSKFKVIISNYVVTVDRKRLDIGHSSQAAKLEELLRFFENGESRIATTVTTTDYGRSKMVVTVPLSVAAQCHTDAHGNVTKLQPQTDAIPDIERLEKLIAKEIAERNKEQAERKKAQAAKANAAEQSQCTMSKWSPRRSSRK